MTQPERAQKRRRFWIESEASDYNYTDDGQKYFIFEALDIPSKNDIPVIEIRENETVIEKELLTKLLQILDTMVELPLRKMTPTEMLENQALVLHSRIKKAQELIAEYTK